MLIFCCLIIIVIIVVVIIVIIIVIIVTSNVEISSSSEHTLPGDLHPSYLLYCVAPLLLYSVYLGDRLCHIF